MVKVETLRRLADIGFMSISGGFFRQAEIIFDAIKMNYRQSVIPYLGLALNLMNKKEYDNALEIIEKKALKIDKNDYLAHAFRGLALMQLKRNNECEKCLQHVIENSDNESAGELAKALLSELHC